MFGKSAFFVRSLFVASILGSLVACTFEPPQEKQGSSTQNITDGEDEDDGATADGSTSDASAHRDGGADASAHSDGGAWGHDGGTWAGDAGAWGDDDDDDDSSDAGAPADSGRY